MKTVLYIILAALIGLSLLGSSVDAADRACADAADMPISGASGDCDGMDHGASDQPVCDHCERFCMSGYSLSLAECIGSVVILRGDTITDQKHNSYAATPSAPDFPPPKT